MAQRKRNECQIEEMDPMAPIECVPHNNQIQIEQYPSDLVVDDKTIPGTSLYRAKLPTGPCVALLKSADEASRMYDILCNCSHPNILKPLGIWKSEADKSKAYIVFEEVDGALSLISRDDMFSIEDSSVWGFSDIGFRSFRAIFSAVDYVNSNYKSYVNSSTTRGFIPLIPLRLSSKTIFFKRTTENDLLVMVGDFLANYPQILLKQNKVKEPTIEHVTQFNWSKVGGYLATCLGKGVNINQELKFMTEYLKSEGVSYDELIWQPGIWEATEKMHLIREIYWIMDRQRGKKKIVPLRSTEKAQVLHKIKRPLGIVSGLQKFEKEVLTEETLLDSVILLRDYILGHYDQSYLFYKGAKSEIGTDKVTCEKFLQKTNGDYMINLSNEIRALKWIPESPVLRDKNNYMQMFYSMKKKELAKEKEMEKKSSKK